MLRMGLEPLCHILPHCGTLLVREGGQLGPLGLGPRMHTSEFQITKKNQTMHGLKVHFFQKCTKAAFKV